MPCPSCGRSLRYMPQLVFPAAAPFTGSPSATEPSAAVQNRAGRSRSWQPITTIRSPRAYGCCVRATSNCHTLSSAYRVGGRTYPAAR